MTPAFNHLVMSRIRRLSPMRCSRNWMSQSRSTLSKNARTSASKIQLILHRSVPTVIASSALCAPRPGHRGRELAYASPPAQIPACALTHGAPASDDDEGQLAKLRVFKPIAVTRETPTQSRLRKCVLHCLVGSAEWSFPPTVGICKPVDTNGGYPCWVSGTRY